MASVSEISVTDYVNPGKVNQHIGALIVSLGGLSLGVTLGWNSSAGDILRNVLNATGTEIGLVGCILNAGACGGIVTLPWLLKYLSRTGIMILTVPICLAGWGFICLADQQVWYLMTGRILTGISTGVFCVLSPIYISEIADENTRAKVLTYFQLFINIGIFYAFFAAHLLEENTEIWRYSLICAMSCSPVALVVFLPESPMYHLRRDEEHLAARSMKFYRGINYDCDKEFVEITKLLKNRIKFLEIMKNRKALHTIVMCHIVIITQLFSGVNTLIFYATAIFNNAGSGDLTGSEQTLVVAVVQIVSCLFCTLLIDSLGRRVLLTVSTVLMGLFMILLGWSFELREDDPELYEESYAWMSPLYTILYFMAFNIGTGPIFWSILGDTLPNILRTFGAVYMASLHFLLSLTSTLTFSYLLESLGVTKTMMLFGGLCCFSSLLCFVFVGETKGKSLAQIQEEFKINESQEITRDV